MAGGGTRVARASGHARTLVGFLHGRTDALLLTALRERCQFFSPSHCADEKTEALVFNLPQSHPDDTDEQRSNGLALSPFSFLALCSE